MFSGTNLLTRCHGVSCLFSFVFGSKKAENQYSRNWMGQNPKSIFYRGGHESIRRDKEANQGGQTPLGAARGGPAPGQGVPPWSPLGLASSPIRSP